MNRKYTEQFIKMLGNLDGLLVKAAAHADVKKFDANNFAQERLIVDMFPLTKQIQVACDNAKTCVGLLSHSEVPKFEDNEKTIPELRERIKKTIDFLKTKLDSDYSQFKTARYAPFWADGQWLDGETYFYEYVLPNFYFHITTAYAILRKSGVEIGKGDYMGSLKFQK